MNIWVSMVSGNAELAETNGQKWKDAGFKLFADIEHGKVRCADLTVIRTYDGHPRSSNQAIADCIELGADIVLNVNDDMFPINLTTTDLIKAWAFAFGESTLGVMQCAGDMWGGMAWAAVCPAVGRDYAKRINGGKGLYWHEYDHYFADQEIRDVAMRCEKYVQHPTLMIYHDHHTRGGRDGLSEMNREHTRAKHEHDRRIYEARRSANFPGSELI